MHKLLIVDDEPMIREGLKSIIDWVGLGFQWVGEAANGPDAITRHAELAPDLILMDIRMPGMDGMQVIEEIRKKDSKCHFLILSGYADFSYAKQAIVYGVDGYILKPIDDEELYEYAQRISVIINKQSVQEISQEQSVLLRREELLQDVMLKQANDSGIAELHGLLGEAIKTYQLMLIQWSLTEEHHAAAVAAAKRKLSKSIDNGCVGWTFSYASYTVVLLTDYLVQNGSRELLKQWLQQAAEPELSYTAVAGEAVRFLADLPHSFETALGTIQYSFLLSPGEIYLGSSKPSDSGEQQEDADGATIEELAQKLFYTLDIGSQEGVQQTLRDAGALICAKNRFEQRIKMSFAQMLTIVINKLTAVHVQLSVQDELRIITDLYKQTHYDDMMQYLGERLSQLAFRLGNSSNVTVIKQMTDFIERHYAENLKLETMAELFNYNSGYLGKMFKNFTGEHFNTYLDQVRIQHAIELLQKGLKVHQVSELVGYANVDYFHSKFKKYKGLSPSSFKGIMKTGSKQNPSK